MFKQLSLSLPENMIERIDKMLLESDFASRSDFFRHLVRLWFLEQKGKTVCAGGHQKQEDGDMTHRRRSDEDVDLEFGIPAHIIREIEIEAKSKI